MNDQLLTFKLEILHREIENYNNSDLADEDYEKELENKKFDLLKEFYGKYGENVIPLKGR